MPGAEDGMPRPWSCPTSVVAMSLLVSPTSHSFSFNLPPRPQTPSHDLHLWAAPSSSTLVWDPPPSPQKQKQHHTSLTVHHGRTETCGAAGATSRRYTLLSCSWATLSELDDIVAQLSAAPIAALRIPWNNAHLEVVLERVLERLHAPTLRLLELDCPACPAALVPFLRSARSHGLERLAIPARPPEELFAAIKEGNSTLTSVGGVHDRAVLSRNAQLTARVRRAAVRELVLARVLFHARPTETQKPSIAALPHELVAKIVVAASDDSGALTPAQRTRVWRQAADRESSAAIAAAMAAASDHAAAMDEWLANGGFVWERGTREGRAWWAERGTNFGCVIA
ncbi:uncharacterized protein LOC62_04G005374 [Vanrija pseudolonga]|uniref:Uncharacterized protein n=1 Tax=Vanrija pseudolonga TaxID=143232 RepID=A0AAF0Y7X1_9TREE|nr:hypothetical protein LOC62_04G005374 [Vanrija pseudolonga]